MFENCVPRRNRNKQEDFRTDSTAFTLSCPVGHEMIASQKLKTQSHPDQGCVLHKATWDTKIFERFGSLRTVPDRLCTVRFSSIVRFAWSGLVVDRFNAGLMVKQFFQENWIRKVVSFCGSIFLTFDEPLLIIL